MKKEGSIYFCCYMVELLRRRNQLKLPKLLPWIPHSPVPNGIPGSTKEHLVQLIPVLENGILTFDSSPDPNPPSFGPTGGACGCRGVLIASIAGRS